MQNVYKRSGQRGFGKLFRGGVSIGSSTLAPVHVIALDCGNGVYF